MSRHPAASQAASQQNMIDDNRALLLPTKPASALDESLPLVQAFVGVALEMHSSTPDRRTKQAAAGSLEEEVAMNKERQRLLSLYKLFPAMLEIVSVDGFRPEKVADMALLVEVAVQRVTHDMDHCIEQMTQSVGPNDANPMCDERGFHTETWQFLTVLSRLLLFDTVEIIAPAANSHLPTQLMLFIGKLQARISQRRAGVKSNHTLQFITPVVTALNTPGITLHPYSTAPTSFEQLNSQLFGMLYIMCKHESALYDVTFGGHLRTLFSVFTNSKCNEAAFHDEVEEFAKTGAPPIWDTRANSGKEADLYAGELYFESSSSYRAGVMMVMTGILKEHPQDGLDYVQLHDLLQQLLATIKSPHPKPKPSKSQEPDPAIEMSVDCLRLCMLILRTAIKHAPTHNYQPAGLTQQFSHLVSQQNHSSAQSSGVVGGPMDSPVLMPSMSQPLSSPTTRPLQLSASSNAVSATMSIPPELFAPISEADCVLLDDFEANNGYDVLRDFVLSVMGDYEVEPESTSEPATVELDDKGRRQRSFIHRKASKQSMVDDFLQQMRELVFIGSRALKPTADVFANAQQPQSMARSTVRQNAKSGMRKSRSGSMRGLLSVQQGIPSSRPTEKLDFKNYYDVSLVYDSIEKLPPFKTAHIPTLSVPSPHPSQPQTLTKHRPFTVNTSASPQLTHICNLAAFDALLTISSQSPSSYVRSLALLHIHSILAAHPYNFLVLRHQHSFNAFAYFLNSLNDKTVDSTCKMIASHILGFLVSFEYYVPYTELLALVQSLSAEAAKQSASSPRSTQAQANGAAPTVLPLTGVGEECVSFIGAVLARILLCDRQYQQPVLFELGLMRICLERIRSFEPALEIQERGTHKKLTQDQENEQRANAGKSKLNESEQRVLHTSMDALHGLMSLNADIQYEFKQADNGKNFAFLSRLLMSDVTRARAIRLMEALVELELKGITFAGPPSSMRRESMLTQSTSSSSAGSRDISPPRSRIASRQPSLSLGPSSAISNASHDASKYGVQAYINLCLDFIHELPVWHYEAKGLFLRSLRYLMFNSRKAQEIFRRRSGLFNVIQLLEKIKVPELQRRKALRRRNDPNNATMSKAAMEAALLRGANSEIEEMRAREEAKLDSLMLYLRDIFQTIASAISGAPESRLQLSRFGYERIIDALHQTEAFGHRHGVECLSLWFAWIAVEYKQGTEDGKDEDFNALTPLHSRHALQPDDIILPVPAQTLMPLYAIPSFSLATKASIAFQLRIVTYFYVLARDDVLNRASLGQAGLLPALIEHYRPLILSSPEDIKDEKKRELRSTVLLLVRVLASFSSGPLEVNALFTFLEEEKWEWAVEALIDITDHANQNGRLWPYVLFDLSRRDFHSHAPRGACVSIDQLNKHAGAWPPRDGYTFSAWIHIDQFSLDDEFRLMLPAPMPSPINSVHPNQPSDFAAVNPANILSITGDIDGLISLFSAESEDGRSFLRLFLYRRQMYLQVSRTSLFHFANVTFEPRSWYHIGMSHTAGGVIATSRASLFVNGQLRQTIRAAYMEPPTLPTTSVRGVIGSHVESRRRRPTSPTMRTYEESDREDAVLGDDSVESDDDDNDAVRLAEHDFSLPPPLTEPADAALAALRMKQPRSLIPFSTSAMSSVMNFANLGGVQWRIAQCQLIDTPLSDHAMHSLYNVLTDDSESSFELGARKTGRENRRFVALAADCFHAESRLRSLIAKYKPSPNGFILPSSDQLSTAALIAAPPRPRSHPAPHVKLDALLVFYHASNLLVSNDGRRVSLLNYGQDQLHPMVSHGELRGSTHLYRPRGLPDSMHKVGGLRRLLVLVARCRTCDALVKALTLLVVMLADSPKNHEEMEDMNGFKLLAFSLKHRIEMIDVRVVDALLALVGLSDRGMTGLIANVEALHALVLDFGLWRTASFTVKQAIFSAILTAITRNPMARSNLEALRSAQLVKYLVSMLCDQHEISFRLTLTNTTLRIISVIVKEDLRENELRLLAEIILIPSLSDEHNPAPMSSEDGAEQLDPRKRSPSMDAQSRELLGDICDTFVKNRVLDMILQAVQAIQNEYAGMLAQLAGNKAAQLDKARERREKVQVFSKVMDLQWFYGVLKNASDNAASFTPSQDEQDEIDAITDPRLHTNTALLALRLLSVLLITDSQLRQQATQSHILVAISHTLCNGRHCLEPKLYEVLFALMLSKQVSYDRPIDMGFDEEDEPTTPEARDVNPGSQRVLSPSKLTGERSPWDYLLITLDSTGKEMEPSLFFPEILPTIFSLVTRALDISATKPKPDDHPAFIATLPSLASTIVSHVFIFMFKYFQRSADFRMLFSMTNTHFLTPCINILFTKMQTDDRRQTMLNELSATTPSNHSSTVVSPRGAGKEPPRVSIAASTRIFADDDSDGEQETFFSAFNASASSSLPPPGLFDSRARSFNDSEEDDAPNMFSPSATDYASAIDDIQRRQSAADALRSPHSKEIDEFERDARDFDVHTFTLATRLPSDNDRELFQSPHGPLTMPFPPAPPSAESGMDIMDELPLCSVDFTDKCLALLYRFLVQIIFHALQHDRANMATRRDLPPNLAVLQHLVLSPPNMYDPVTGLALPTANAQPAVVGSHEGWSIVDDIIDLVPQEAPSAMKVDFVTRLLRYLASRVHSRVNVWSAELLVNEKLANNFLKLCQMWTTRMTGGLFQQGAFAVSSVAIEMLEQPSFQNIVLKQGLFAKSVNKQKAKIVGQLLISLHKALLIGYADAARRRAVTEIQWLNALVLAHPKHFIDPPTSLDPEASSHTLACLIFQLFETILFADDWVRATNIDSARSPTSAARARGADLEDNAMELAARARYGAMQIMAALIRGGKQEAIWRLLLNTEEKTSTLFTSKHAKAVKSIFGQGFDAMTRELPANLMDWIIEFDQDIKVILENTIAQHWLSFAKVQSNERKQLNSQIEARIRAFARICALESQEKQRLLTRSEQDAVRAMKSAYDSWLSAVIKRHDSEENERLMQEQFEAILRELKKLEVALIEKEEKAHEAKRQQSQAIMKQEGAIFESKNAAPTKNAAVAPEEEAISEIERKKRREQAAKWKVDTSNFWDRNELAKKRTRKRNNQDDDAAENDGDNDFNSSIGASSSSSRSRRSATRGQVPGAMSPSAGGFGVDLAALGADPTLIAQIAANPMLASMLATISANPAMLASIIGADLGSSFDAGASPDVQMKQIMQNPQAINKFLGTLTAGLNKGVAAPASTQPQTAPTQPPRADLLAAISAKRKTSDVVISDSAPPPPPLDDSEPSIAPPMMSPFAGLGDDDGVESYGPSKLPMFKSDDSSIPPAPPVLGDDVPFAPPMDDSIPGAPPMAPPMDDGIPGAPPMAPPMDDGVPGAPPMAPMMDGVPGAPPMAPGMDSVPPPPPFAPGFGAPPPPTFAKPAPAVKMKKLHWEAVDSSAVTKDSIWGQLNVANTGIDFGEFESKFSATAAKPIVKPVEAAKPKFVSLLDPRRQQAIEIGLSRFGLDHDGIVKAILAVDTTKLNTEHFKRLQQFAPTSDEMKSLKSFRGDQAMLGVAEKFHMSLLNIPALTQRLDAIVANLTLDERVVWVDNQLNCVENAISKIKTSKYLQEVLTTVLAFGNYMNGNAGKQVTGFKLSTLTKLGNTKAADNKTSLLHYLVMHLEKSKPEVRDFVNDLAPTKEAHRIETQFIQTEVNAIRAQVAQMSSALKAVQSAPPIKPELGAEDRFNTVITPALADAQAKLAKAEDRYKSILAKGEKLSKYFGELDMKWEDLFSIFNAFANQYLSAEADVQRERDLAKQREKTRALQAKLKAPKASAEAT